MSEITGALLMLARKEVKAGDKKYAKNDLASLVKALRGVGMKVLVV